MAKQYTGIKPEKKKKDADGNPDLDELSLGMGNRPPQAIEVEEAVVGAMLVESDCAEDAVRELSLSSFYNPRYAMIFEAVKQLVDSHQSIDFVTVTQQLRRNGNLENVGGGAALAELSQKIGAAAHIERYIQILKEKDMQRKLISASYQIIKDSYDEAVNVGELVVSAQGKIFDATQDSNRTDVSEISSVISQALERIQHLQSLGTRYSGVPSGFKGLDEVTGGFQASDLIILAARPSVGKTAFVINVARNASVDFNEPVAIFSLEMPSIQLATRMMISETGIDAAKLKGGRKFDEGEWDMLERKIVSLSKAPLYIDDTPSLSVYEFRSKVQRLVKQKGVKMVVVDYLQLMQGPKELRGMREQEVAAISRTLKATAKEFNIPIIALSQLSRNAVQRQNSNNRPQLSDLRESGSIEQDADMVLFLHRFDYQGTSENPEDVGKTLLIIAKHRNGEIRDIPLTFRSGEVRFVDESESLMQQVAQMAGRQQMSQLSPSAMNSDSATPQFIDDPYAGVGYPDGFDQ